jgi:hypothetical protein
MSTLGSCFHVMIVLYHLKFARLLISLELSHKPPSLRPVIKLRLSLACLWQQFLRRTSWLALNDKSAASSANLHRKCPFQVYCFAKFIFVPQIIASIFKQRNISNMGRSGEMTWLGYICGRIGTPLCCIRMFRRTIYMVSMVFP